MRSATRTGASVSMSARRPGVSPKFCSRAAPGGSTRWMWVATSCIHACASDRRSYPSRAPTSAGSDPALLSERPEFVTIDASFISLRLLLPAVLELLQKPAHLLALIKPQFEAGRTQVKKGIVRDPRVHAAVCDDIASFVTSRGWHVRGIVASPIAGGDGNREFFIGAHHA